MHNLQKAGGIAAVLLGGLFSAYMMLLAVVLPAQGFGPGTLNDPHTGVRFVATSALPAIIDGVYVGLAAAFLPITLALYGRLRAGAPASMPVSAAAGVLASGMFLLYAMLNLVGMPTVISLYQHDSAAAGTLYLVLRTVANAMNAGALFAAGWAILLAGRAAITTHALRPLLGWLMVAAGLAMIGSFVLLPIGLLAVLLAPIWSVWLGLALLRGSAALDSARLIVPQKLQV